VSFKSEFGSANNFLKDSQLVLRRRGRRRAEAGQFRRRGFGRRLGQRRPGGRWLVGQASCLSHSFLILETGWKPVLRWQRISLPCAEISQVRRRQFTGKQQHKKCPGFDKIVSEFFIDREARMVNNAGSVERNILIWKE
jgi:hypothetical protein